MLNHRSLWLDPSFGASGDMMLGVLVGLGASMDRITEGLNVLPVDGWSLSQSSVQRCSLAATRVAVGITEEHHHRTWSSIDKMLADAALPPSVIPPSAIQGARATFRALGLVEADIHGVTIDDVHFHEVGAVDAIVDIVGSWLALDLLAVDEVVCGPIGLGHGVVEAAHGQLPLPAPATAALLSGAPIRSIDVAAETVTPTGAALLGTMSDRFGSLPTGRLGILARGAGGRDPDQHPNVLSGYLIDSARESNAEFGGEYNSESTGQFGGQPSPDQSGVEIAEALVLQTNLDDVTGETVAHTIKRCLELGADDAWAHPIIMKKGRPGIELNVLASPEVAETLRQTLFTETSSLGLRTSTVTKYAQPRSFQQIELDGHTIRVKVGPHGAKPEYDDLASAADGLGRPLAEVANQTLRLFFQRFPPR